MKAVVPASDAARIPPVRQELYGLQMLRAVGALLVIFHHALEASMLARVGPFSPDWLTTAGAAGVDIFFVISGFIMMYISFATTGRTPRPAAFLSRRLLRIYPLYWVCLAIAIFIGLSGMMRRTQFTIPDIIGAILLFPSRMPIMGLTWTLSLEILFYLIFAATLFKPASGRSFIIVVVSLLALTVVGVLLPTTYISNSVGNPIVIEFCFGLGIAWLMLNGKLPKIDIRWSLLAFAVLFAAPVFVEHPNTGGLTDWPRVAAWGIPSAIIITSFVFIGKPRSAFGQLVVLLGDASYAIYLTHFFSIGIYARLLRTTWLSDVPQYYVVPVVVAFMTAIGVATHFLVERNLARFVRALTRPPKHGVEPTIAENTSTKKAFEVQS